jgi:hypothetical protein
VKRGKRSHSHSECIGAAKGGMNALGRLLRGLCGGCYFSRSRRPAISASSNLTCRANHRHNSSSQELSPRRKIRRGLFDSDNTLSGNTLPSAPNLKADPADRRAPGEDNGQAGPESTLPRHCASPPSSTCLQTLKPNPTQPSPRGRGHITDPSEGVRNNCR